VNKIIEKSEKLDYLEDRYAEMDDYRAFESKGGMLKRAKRRYRSAVYSRNDYKVSTLSLPSEYLENKVNGFQNFLAQAAETRMNYKVDKESLVANIPLENGKAYSTLLVLVSSQKESSWMLVPLDGKVG
jgi:hypothetical protein